MLRRQAMAPAAFRGVPPALPGENVPQEFVAIGPPLEAHRQLFPVKARHRSGHAQTGVARMRTDRLPWFEQRAPTAIDVDRCTHGRQREQRPFGLMSRQAVGDQPQVPVVVVVRLIPAVDAPLRTRLDPLDLNPELAVDGINVPDQPRVPARHGVLGPRVVTQLMADAQHTSLDRPVFFSQATATADVSRRLVPAPLH